MWDPVRVLCRCLYCESCVFDVFLDDAVLRLYVPQPARALAADISEAAGCPPCVWEG